MSVTAHHPVPASSATSISARAINMANEVPEGLIPFKGCVIQELTLELIAEPEDFDPQDVTPRLWVRALRKIDSSRPLPNGLIDVRKWQYKRNLQRIKPTTSGILFYPAQM